MNLFSSRLFKILSIIVFIMYIFLLVFIITFKCGYTQVFVDTYFFLKDKSFSERMMISLNKFYKYVDLFQGKNVWSTISDSLLNIIVFIPLGLYLAYFIKNNKLLKVLLISFLSTVFFELFQFFSLIGSFSIFDLLANTLGGILGYLLYRLIYNDKMSNKRIMILNIISIIVIIIFIPTVIYAVIIIIENLPIYIDIILRRLSNYKIY